MPEWSISGLLNTPALAGEVDKGSVMKNHITLAFVAAMAAVSLPSCVSFDDDDDDIRPVATTTVTEQTNPSYGYGYPTTTAATVAVAPRTAYPSSVTVNPAVTTRTTRTTYVRRD